MRMARRCPTSNTVFFPLLQRNPINKCTVKGPGSKRQWTPGKPKSSVPAQGPGLYSAAASVTPASLQLPSHGAGRRLSAARLKSSTWYCPVASRARQHYGGQSKGLLVPPGSSRGPAWALESAQVGSAGAFAHLSARLSIRHAGKSSGGLSP